MVCLDASFLVDLLGGRDAARGVMEELDDRRAFASVTPITAAELWVGASLGSVAECDHRPSYWSL